MPRSLKTSGGLSSKHLPDESDTSLSFQIPTSMRGDYLLADDGESFFRGAGDILASPTAPRFTLDHTLLLSHPTPILSGGERSKSPPLPQASAGPSERMEDNPPLRRSPRKKKQRPEQDSKVKSKPVTQAMRTVSHPQVFSAIEQSDSLKTAVNALAEEVDNGADSLPSNSQKLIVLPTRPPNRGKDAPGNQQERQEKTTRGSRPRRSKKRSADATEDIHSPIHSPVRGTVQKTPEDPSGIGIVEAQAMLDSAEVLTSSVTHRAQSPYQEQPVNIQQSPLPNEPTETRAESPARMVVDSPPSTSADSVLTLPQLSPQKDAISSQQRNAVRDRLETRSPLTSTLSSKRPAPEGTDEIRPHKKTKTSPETSRSDEGSTKTRISRSASSSRASAGRRLSGSRSRPIVTAKRSVVRPRTSGTLLAATRNAKLRNANASRQQAEPSFSRGKDAAPRTSLKARVQMKSRSGSSNSRPLAEQGSSGSAHGRKGVIRATVPHEFRFHVDTRLEARKSQSEKVEPQASSSKHKSKHSIPDFKALHAAHEADLALRKEHIHLVIPVPPKFETDARMKERQKFEEHLREKELQRHEELEQKRREMQQREEEEIRELRKKAIPKAHEVPEWYKDAPKKVKSGKGT